MKNKEIEELLNKMKNCNGVFDYYLEFGEVDLLLSYIEQLEKRNKELYEGFMATQEELTDYATKNEQLENNRDKALRIIDKYKETYIICFDKEQWNFVKRLEKCLQRNDK